MHNKALQPTAQLLRSRPAAKLGRYANEYTMEIIIFLVLLIAAWVMISSHLKEKRRAALFAKYGDAEIVDNIMNRMFWQGQTPEQLADSIGNPVDIDRKVMKTKTREVWKYNETGKGRFALRITLEDGVVVGWDKKS
jgi:hypothetical protein